MSDQEHHPKWVKQQELILKKWSEEAAAFRFMHDRSYKRFARLHMNFSLPVIILSTIAGTANFSTGSFPAEYREYVSLATGGINLIAGMITTIAQFMKIPEMLEAHRASSNDFAKFSRNIRVELSLPIRERTCTGREFLEKCRGEMEVLMERAPDISLSLVKSFGNKFKKKELHMPDIIDLTTVDIFEDVEELNRMKVTKEREIEMAANKLLKEKEKTQVHMGHVTSSLSSFMSNLTESVKQDMDDIEKGLERPELDEEKQ